MSSSLWPPGSSSGGGGSNLFPNGIIIDATLTAARPVGSLVLNTADNEIYRSTNATVATYDKITNVGGGGFTGIYLATAAGTLTSYGTIAGAMGAAATGDTILLYPGSYAEDVDFTGKTNVYLVGIGAPNGAIITGSAATTTRVTLASGCAVRNLTIERPSSGANPTIDVTSLTAIQQATIASVVFKGAGTATGADVKGPGAGSVAIVEPTFNGGVMGQFLDTAGGSGTVLVDRPLLVAGTVGTVFKIDGTAKALIQDVIVNTAITVTDLFEVGGTAFIEVIGILENKTVNVTNALHIVADGVTVELMSTNLRGNVWDILVDGGLTGVGTVVEISGGLFTLERMSAPAGWFAGLTEGLAAFMDPGVNNDPAYRIGTEFTVGIAARPSEAAFGEGDSTTSGMTVLQTNAAESPFVDVTSALVSASGSTADLWHTNAGTDKLYVICTDPRQFPGIKADVVTATTAGEGATNMVTEYWNGAAWAELPVMATDADQPYEKHACDLFTRAASDQIRFDPPSDWATTAVNSISGYIIRFRQTAVFTTNPVLQRIKLGTNRTELNKDGFQEYFGDAQYLFFSAPSIRPVTGLSPTSTSTQYSTNIQLDPLFNNQLVFNKDDGIGWLYPEPPRRDTSRPVKVRVFYYVTAATAGDMEFELRTVEVFEGSAVDGTASDVLTTHVESIPVNVEDTWRTFDIEVSLPDVVATSVTVFQLVRLGSTGASDTYGGNTVIEKVEIVATAWRE